MKTKNVIIILAFCCIFAIIASVIASSYPDGLEWVAEKLNFIGASEGKEAISSPMPDYMVPWIKNPYTSSALAAILGTTLVFIVTYLIVKMLRKGKS